MSKKHKKPAKPQAPATMKAARQCAHAQCADMCTATTARQLRKEDLPRRAQAALADRDKAIDALRQFTVDALADLERRAGVVVGRPEEGPGEELRDGYPTSLRRTPGTRGRAARLCREEILVAGNLVTCDERVPCEKHPSDNDNLGQLPPPSYADPGGELAAALADGEVTESDATPNTVRRVYRQFERAVDELLRVSGLMADVRANPLAGRGSSVGVCRACDATVTGVGEDRLRPPGYCDACRKAWVRLVENWDGDGSPDREAFEAGRRAKRKDEAA